MNRIIASFGLFIFSATALAQSEEPPSLVTELPTATEEVPDGWYAPLSLSLGSSLSWYDNVVGNPEGRTSLYSLDIDASVNYFAGSFEWRNRLKLQETVTRTPLVDEYIKTIDEFNYESIGMKFSESIKWLGYYGRVAYKTQAFQGFDVRTEETTYVIQETDGDVRTENSDQLKLTDAFKPAVVKEGLGGVVRPIKSQPLNVEVRLGPGARQYLADGQLVVNDDAETEGVIEILELEDSSQYGAEAALNFTGLLISKQIGYELYAEVFTPFQYDPKSDDDDRSMADVTSSEVGAKVEFFIVEWAALAYNFRNRKEPLLFPQAQTSHSVLFNLTYKKQ